MEVIVAKFSVEYSTLSYENPTTTNIFFHPSQIYLFTFFIEAPSLSTEHTIRGSQSCVVTL